MICGKNSYPNRKIAKKELKKLKLKGRDESEAYYCEGCDAYHLTSWNKVSSRKFRRRNKK